MKYKNRGYTLSFRYPEDPKQKKFCEILATYTRSKRDLSKYNIEIKLEKIVHEGGQEFKFEHYIDTQPIPAKSRNVKSRIARVVDYAVTHGEFDEHFNAFAAEIKKSLFI